MNENLISLIVIGVYTLVYIIVFILQKNQINSQKDVIDSMKSFMDIFKMDDLTKYVNIKTETMKLELENKIVKFNNDFKSNSEKVLIKLLDKEIHENTSNFSLRYNEVFKCLISFILTLPIEERIEFIENELPLTKETFKKILMDNNELPSS